MCLYVFGGCLGVSGWELRAVLPISVYASANVDFPSVCGESETSFTVVFSPSGKQYL